MMPETLLVNRKCAIRQLFDKDECPNAIRIKICMVLAQCDGNPEMNRSPTQHEGNFMN